MKKKQLGKCTQQQFKMAFNNTYRFNAHNNTLLHEDDCGPIVSASKCALNPSLCYDYNLYSNFAKTKCHVEFWQPSHLFGNKRLTQVIIPAGTTIQFPNGEFGGDTSKYAYAGVIGNIFEGNGLKYFARSYDGTFHWSQRRMMPFGPVYVSEEAAVKHCC